MEFELVIFDLDGVLVDSSSCHAHAFNDLWSLLELTGPSYESIAGRSTIEVIEQATIEKEPKPEQIAEWVAFKQQRAREYMVNREIAFEDSEKCIRFLHEIGQRLALGTGASRETAQMVLRRFGWETAFSTIVTGEDVVNGKPAPEIFLKIMDRMNILPIRTLIVEDSRSGLSAALASNAFSAIVRSGIQIQNERFIGSFPDIESMLRSINEVL